MPILPTPSLPPQNLFGKKLILKLQQTSTYILSDELTTLFSLMNQKPCFRSKSFNRYVKV